MKGAALLLGIAAAIVAGAALQERLNPDIAGYVVTATAMCAVGVAIACEAAVRALPDWDDPRLRHIAAAVVALPIVGVVWVLVMIASGMVGLATMVAAVSMPVYGSITGVGRELLVFLTLVAGFIVFTHRSNIGRILRGEENRMVKAMFWRRQR